MTIEEALEIAQRVLEQGSLSKVQEIVLRQSWEGKSYQEIAKNSGYELAYVRNIGCKLWQSFSKVFGKKVSKNNFYGMLKQQHVANYNQVFNKCNTLTQETLQQKVIVDDLPLPTNTTDQCQKWGEAIDVSIFYGRTAELDILNKWFIQDRCRLLAILGVGGIGKTALAVKLTQQVQHDFKYLIWYSLRNTLSINKLLKDTILFLSRQEDVKLPESLDSLLSCLMEYLHQYRCLIVLDNFESILCPGEKTGRYREGYEGYGQLLRRVSDEPHQSCLLLTSREKPIGLKAKEGTILPVRSLQLIGLQQEAAQEVLKAKGLASAEAEFRNLIDYYAGNPLILSIAATTIQSLFNGDISKFLAQNIIIFGDIRELLDQQYNRLSAMEKQVMYQLANHQEYVTPLKLLEEIEPTLSRQKLLEALESLQQRSLLQKNSYGFTQQSLIMEYITAKYNDC